MTAEQEKIKAYVNAIEKRLRVSVKMKARINSDLGTEIHLLLEQGKTVDEVINEIGTPDEVAERFNDELKEYAVEKRGPLACLFLILAAVSAFYGAAQVILYFVKPGEGISVIGGADGPTSVYLAGKVGGPWVPALSCLGLCMACYAAYILVRHKKKMSMEKSKYALLWSVAAFALSAAAFFMAGIVGSLYGSVMQWTLAFPGFSGRGTSLTTDPAFTLSLIVMIISIRRYRRIKRMQKEEGSSDESASI